MIEGSMAITCGDREFTVELSGRYVRGSWPSIEDIVATYRGEEITLTRDELITASEVLLREAASG